MRTTEKKSTVAAGTTGTSSNTQAFAQLRMRTLNGAYLRFGYMLPKKVSERLDWELGVIQNRGVADYFQLSGSCSNGVPGAMPCVGSPCVGSYSYPQIVHLYFIINNLRG